MHYERRRKRLVEELAAAGIRDERVLKAFAEVPRHLFVPEPLAPRAYENTSLPLAEGQTISQPLTVARTLQVLALKGEERVLEIGTGSGYQAALLARLADRVFTIERIEVLARRARRVLDSLDFYQVNIRVGDGTLGWSRYQPYDVIVLAAAGPEVPRTLLEQMAPGGRMVAPVGDNSSQQLVLVRRTAQTTTREVIDPCRFVPLIGKDAWPK
ncbi:MAG: protein-L-isoaspartate(D-aspartate) O-methyltransferase [Candidatus Glassbacteria bacterium]|nr:protein-L-isoaspartate(D-aspartate) O-methyltransferase [Candidatus Glassbacteria bacterium]